MERLYPILEEQMEGGGSGRLIVTGSSMLPTLRQGRDSVVLKRPGTLQRGDIILYRRRSEQYVLHRIIRVREGGLLCCGDNQWQTERVEQDQVLAVVTAVQRRGRSFSTAGLCFRLWTVIWLALFPGRRPLIAVRRRLGRIKRFWKNRGC